MTRFFIHRPIFASVISLIIVIAGLVAGRVLPVAQYPEIAPPTVVVTATYPGASAETLVSTIAAPVEEQLNGVPGLLFYLATAGSNGVLTLTLTFEVGTNVDQATIDVNNAVKIAEPRLPEEVRRNGLLVQKRSNDILLVVSIRSPEGRHDTLTLSNFASVEVLDEIKRVPGVGNAFIFGARDYAMRIWLKPDRMARLSVTTGDVIQAVRAQNAQYAAGAIGQEPALPGQSLVYSVKTRGRLLAPESFGEIIVRAGGPEGVLRLKDVATIELGAQNYDAITSLDGEPTIGIPVFLQPGANALETANRIRARMEELQKTFPEGVEYVIPFDTTRFVRASIQEVAFTLGEAGLLVVLVVFVFLQNWRATLIPILAVPVSLIGTFAGLWALGFSINTLTLFAMVLAIGIVVDDAIVVLENVERLMREQGLAPREAAVAAMREVAAAVVAIVLVLCAVFIPVAFLGGIAGRLYQQFAVTVAIAVVISGIVALTLTPALCALLLQPSHHDTPLFRPFNRAFAGLTRFYIGGVGWLLRHGVVGLVVFLAVIAGAYQMLMTTPKGFIPPEDQGYLIGASVLPDGATLPRTNRFGLDVRELVAREPAVDHAFVVAGFDLIGGGNKTNAATMFVPLDHWDERPGKAAPVLAGQFMGAAAALREGMAFFFNPPPIRGLGMAGGFEVYLQSRKDPDPAALFQVANQFMAALRAKKELTGINSFYRPTTPQLRVEVDEAKAESLAVPVASIYEALQATMGAFYVNDFDKGGRSYRVLLQAEAGQRARPEDVGQVHVRTRDGEMVPLSALLRVKSVVGPSQMERYNGFLAAKIMGNGVAGVSSGQVIRLVEEVAGSVLPEGYRLAWTGQAFQEKRTGSTAVVAFVFAMVMVFLVLAAQFERWSLPLAVILSVPFALLGALAAIAWRGMPNDIYFQIGLITLIGLASKNAILIVEFASQKMEEGMEAGQAAVAAARLRFRPILMTSLAFVLGVAPLVWAHGAGAAARRSMGTGVFGGMLVATFVATLFVPLFFAWFSRGKKSR